MHILTLILSGLVLLAVFYTIANKTGRSLRSLLPAYLGLWFIISLINMWVGVTVAGYSVAEEAVVLLPIFGVPALVAYMLARKR